MTPDDPMRVGDEDFRTPSQMFSDTMRDFGDVFSGRPLRKMSDAEERARDAYWHQRETEAMERDL